MPAAAPDIRDIKPLVPLPHEVPYLLVGAAVMALLAAAILVWWWRQRTRKRAAAVEPPPPADVVAMAALRALREAWRAGRIDVQRYFFDLSQALRAYVEVRWGVNATDLTTIEIRARLRDRGAVAPGMQVDLVRLLEDADAVKFAKQEATAEECEAAFSRACAFLEATKVPPEPAGTSLPDAATPRSAAGA